MKRTPQILLTLKLEEKKKDVKPASCHLVQTLKEICFYTI